MESLLPVKVLEEYRQFEIQLVEERGAAVCCLLFLTIHTALFLPGSQSLGSSGRSQNFCNGCTIWIHSPCFYSPSFGPLPTPLLFRLLLNLLHLYLPQGISVLFLRVQAQHSGSRNVYTHFLENYD